MTVEPFERMGALASMVFDPFFHLVSLQCLEFIKPLLEFMPKLLLLIKWPRFSK